MSLNLSPPNTLARQHQQQQPQHQPQHPHRYNYTTYPQQQPQQQNLPAFYPQLQQQLQQHLQQQLEKLPFDGSNTNSSDLAGLDLPEFGADLDLDFDLDLDSLSSSPASTQSLLSRFPSLVSSPLTALDGLPTPVLAEPSLFAPSQQSTRALVAASDAMQTETWMPSGGQVTPRSVGPFSHHRESSRSSMGSNGPMSPFPNNLITPQIAANDSAGDSFHGLPNSEDLGNYQLAAKAFPSVANDGFYAIHTGYAPAHGPATTSSMASYPYVATAPRRTDAGRALLIPSEHPIGPGRSQPVSHPVSVASSIAPDSPATPAGEPEEDRKRSMARVPRLDRTTTDAYADELYSPDFTNLASSSSGQASISPTSDLFTQRIQAANQHLSAVSNSPVSATSRDRSPFCQGSPLAPLPMHDFPATAMGPSQVRFGSAQQLREQNKAALDAQAMAHQHMSRSVATSTPQTISPRDAMLDYHEPDGDANFPPLFPPSNNNGFNPDVGQKAAQAQQAYGALSLDNNGFNNFMGTTSMPTSMQMAQPYLFGVQRPQSAVPSASNMSVATTRLGSADTGLTDSVHGTPQRPLDTRADGGTYTCTYHGCTLRFDTPALLQKHKREGHRHPHGLGSGTRRPEGAVTLLNTQAGPHRCDRINPSTGKACNTIFSRPYDLTRHEDTIHNARKQKVRCDLCTDEKTFSRADALTRHYRVCHPDVEFPGKQRRRGAHSG